MVGEEAGKLGRRGGASLAGEEAGKLGEIESRGRQVRVERGAIAPKDDTEAAQRSTHVVSLRIEQLQWRGLHA